jgi:hypothetical protein
MLTHLPRHRKNGPPWGKHRIQPTPAFSRFSPIRTVGVEGQLRVVLTPSPRHGKKPLRPQLPPYAASWLRGGSQLRT